MAAPSYAEWPDSQEPALRLLEKLGWTVLTPAEALALRGGSTSEVLLRPILEAQLRRLNPITYRGQRHELSEGNAHEVAEKLRRLPEASLIQANETAYDLLMLGTSVEQEVEGDRKSPQVRYVEWEERHAFRNQFHVVPEFEVQRADGSHYRPDLVLFVNGIPFVVVECKRRDKNASVEAGIHQMLRNQKPSGIPRLFYTAQLVLSVQPNAVKYGTVGTEERFWSVWKEPEAEAAVRPLIQDRGPGTYEPCEQDRALWSLLRPRRLLELARLFVVFDAGVKKVARYQQYFAVKATMDRIRRRDAHGRRQGGVIWHTQGSGKSLTMVMLAKALALADDIRRPRVVLVTDRKSLDKQLEKTFRHCGKEVQRATTGTDLAALLQDARNDVITALVNKFKTVAERKLVEDDGANIFVLVDESHRTQYGTLHALMRRVLPTACYIGFTGTPLLRKEKNTARKFGGLIEPSYTIEQAVEDGAVVPLLYEGRHARQVVYERPLDRAFDRVAEPLSDEQTRDLKRKATAKERLAQTQQTLEEVVYDVVAHYTEHWQGTGFKAMLVVPSRAAAVRAHEIVERDGRVASAVVISGPDQRELDEDDEAPMVKVRAWWQATVEARFGGDEEAYDEHVIDRFKEYADDDPGIELLIVVSKLITGFDAPRATVLYVYKQMREHTLLQAIARVNRLHAGKDFGYVLDYWGILGELDEALTSYSALGGYDADDLAGSLRSVREEVDKLGQHHTDLWDVFAGVENTGDIEQMERHLADDERRDTFYERLTDYARTLQLALSTEHYYESVPEAQQRRYLKDLKFFTSLRRSVRLRYAEAVDFGEYERRVEKLLDTHVAVEDIEHVVRPVNVFDRVAFAEEVERVTGSVASKADAIAHRTKKVLIERMDEDPVFYKKLSTLVEEAIKAFRQQRLSELEYLARVQEIESEVESGHLQ
ncbi:MAG: HsdR family type I site-specific deoxyribonuclease, partial [Bacteroidota bacterium]